MSILKPKAKVEVPAVKRFVAAEHFKRRVIKGVKIAFVGSNFTSNLLNKVEEDVPAVNLRAHELQRASLDAPIIRELGDRHETPLAHIWALIAQQPNGEEGTLLVNGYTNIFYCYGLAVYVRWFDGGWYFFASSVERPDEWVAGSQVFGS